MLSINLSDALVSQTDFSVLAELVPIARWE
jgi:hypothetical protein